MPTITLSRPLQGQAVTIVVTSKNAKIVLDFSTDGVPLSRDGDSLVFTFEDDASIRIDDFYTSYHADNVPQFEVAGKIVSGTEFFSALGPDLIPAAGPASVERGSHYNEYGASDLMDGLDHLDGLDMSVAGSAAESDRLLTAPLGVGGGSSGADPGGEAAPGGLSADVRAVLYSAGDSENHFVSTPVFFRDASGNLLNLSSGASITRTSSGPDSVSCTFPAEWDSGWLAEPEFSNGQLVFRFSEDGLAKLQSLDPGDFLRGFVTVTVVKDGYTFEYIVEVVASGGSSFDSQAYDAEYGAVSRFGTESVGEYHQGTGQTGSYQIVASTGDDDIILNDTVIGGSSIHASGSADPAQMADDYNTINLNAGVANTTPGSTTHITSADGKLTVLDGVLASVSGAENVIHMGKGEIHISNAAGHGVSAANDGSNSITTTENGSVTVNATASGNGVGMKAESSGSNKIKITGDGDVTVTGNGTSTYRYGYGMSASDNGSNKIKIIGDGDVTVTGNGTSTSTDRYGYGYGYGMSASGGSNKIKITGDGDVTVTGNGSGHSYGYGYGMYAVASGSNSITTESGDVTVTGNGSCTNTDRDGNSYGMYAHSSGSNSSSNSITTDSGDVIVAGNGSGSGEGMSANGGSNSITTDSGDVTVTGTGNGHSYAWGYGMSAKNSGSNKIKITGDGDVTVTGTGDGHSYAYGYGMSASDNGSNKIKITGDGDVTVTGNGQGYGYGLSHGMSASYNGSNKIKITGDGDVTVTGNGSGTGTGDGYGMSAVVGSNKIKITGDGDVTVTGNGDGDSYGYASGTGRGYGMSAHGGSNKIKITGDGDVTVTGTGTGTGTAAGNGYGYGWGYGMHADSGSNSITTESGAVAVTGTGQGYGSGSRDGDGNGYGMFASGGGSNNSITTESGSVTVTGTGTGQSYGTGNGYGHGYGMSARCFGSDGSNSITTKSGDVTVSGSGSGIGTGEGVGMHAHASRSSASNTITTGSGNVTVTGSGKSGYGMHADSSGSSNSIITGSGNVTVTGQAEENYGYGMYASGSGSNSIETQNGSITVTSSGSGLGIHAVYATGGSTNTIKGGLGSSVTLKSAREALNAQGGGKNIITGGDVSVQTTASNSTGVYATGSLSENSIDALQSVTITSNMHGVSANSEGLNSIKGNDITIQAGSNANAYGVYAKDDTTANKLTAQSGLVTISAGKHALFAEAGGKNTVTGKGGMLVTGSESGLYALDTNSANTVTATAGAITIEAANANSYALRAENKGVNTVSGSETVTLGGGKFGMHASSGGQNDITSNGVDISATNNALYASGADSSGAGSSNAVNAGNGAVTLNANAAVSAFQGAYNSITTSGNIDVNGVSYGLYAENANSYNTLNATSGGTVSIVGGTEGMHAAGGGKNYVATTNGKITITGNNANNTGFAVQASGNGSTNTIGAGTAGQVVISGGKYGINAEAEGKNSVTGGDISITSTCPGTDVWNTEVAVRASGSESTNTVDAGAVGKIIVSGGRHSLEASSGGKNNISGGDITITNTSNMAVCAYSKGTNIIDGGSDGNVAIKGGNIVVYASSEGKNKISGSNINISEGSAVYNTTVNSANQSDRIVYADNGANTIDAGPDGKISISGKWTVGAANGGTNDIRGGDITITGGASSPTVWANGKDSTNTVDAGPAGKVTINSFYESLNAYNKGSNTVKGGDITLTASHSWALWANGADTSNTVDAGPGGKVTIDGKSSGLIAQQGINSVTGGKVSINSDGGSALSANYGQNIVEGSDIAVTSGKSSGLSAGNGGKNTITGTGGQVHIKGATGIYAYDEGQNSVTGKNITIDGTIGLHANYYGQNPIQGGTNTVSANGTVSVEAVSVGLLANGTGSGNTITSNDVSITAGNTWEGIGLSAKDGGMNKVESTSGSPLTVTITASAIFTEKAIALWADGGGSVNYITGHSQAGDADTITLHANKGQDIAGRGQGIAMQGTGGGRNVITTGAGNDSVTINGKIVGSGNEINLGGGDNTLTINGEVQSGSLNVSAAGGTYMLILQAASVQSFIDQYGSWLNDLGTAALLSGGIMGIDFAGLDTTSLSTGFLPTFNGLLWDLKTNGVSIKPPALYDEVHDPAIPFSAPFAATLAYTGADHHMPDAAQDAQHAAGHDDMQDSSLAAHDGPAPMTDHMTGDSPETIFSAQADNTAQADTLAANVLGADALEPDDAAQMNFAEGEDADGQVQPLFAFLSDPADRSTDMLTDDMPADLFEEGDDALHNGYLGNEGDGSDFAELYPPVTLTYGDESLDNLFAATDVQDTEKDGTGLFGETGLHDMGLTDMNAALDQSHLAGSASPDAPPGPAMADASGAAAATIEISNIPSAADYCQEATDNATRAMITS